MKKMIKIIILLVLVISSSVFGLRTGILKGLILIIVSVLGVFILERRDLNRMIGYFEPLLFRCGRDIYVEESLILVENQLLFKSYFKKRLLYLFVGVHNVRGDYNRSIEIIENTYPDMTNCKDKKLTIEWNYAMLKKGKSMVCKGQKPSHREKLCYALYLLNIGHQSEAIEKLHDLRCDETGNVIFREVNLLLSQLYLEIDQEEAQYYKIIADSFYNS